MMSVVGYAAYKQPLFFVKKKLFSYFQDPASAVLDSMAPLLIRSHLFYTSQLNYYPI